MQVMIILHNYINFIIVADTLLHYSTYFANAIEMKPLDHDAQ